jgi:hypothetical protein
MKNHTDTPEQIIQEDSEGIVGAQSPEVKEVLQSQLLIENNLPGASTLKAYFAF